MNKVLSICIIFVMLTAFTSGYDRGLHDGKHDGKIDCLKYGEKEVLRKIPPILFKSSEFKKGYTDGYLDGYQLTRYAGLR